MTMVTTRDGTRLFCKELGHGRPVVLIHGWPLTSDSWDPIALALAEAGFRAIVYDRRGFGRCYQSGTHLLPLEFPGDLSGKSSEESSGESSKSSSQSLPRIGEPAGKRSIDSKSRLVDFGVVTLE